MQIAVRDIEVGYGEKPVLHGINATFPAGRMSGIIGPNGSGKSTLLKVIGRQLTPSCGTVRIDGQSLSSIHSRELARRLAFLPQTPTFPPEMTVSELISLGRYPHIRWHERFAEHDRRVIEAALDACELRPMAHRALSTLSGGECRRAWLAMALAKEPKSLLLDEPLAFLDVHHQLEVLEFLRDLHQRCEITVIMVLHDLNLAARYCDWLLAIRDGYTIASGAVESVIQPDVIQSVFDVNVRIETDPYLGRPSCQMYPCESEKRVAAICP